MAQTTTTTFDSAIQTKFEKKLLSKIVGKSAGETFATGRPMQKGEGDTIRWNRIERAAKQTSYNLSETSATNTPKALTTDYIEATLGTVGDAFSFTTAATYTSIITDESISDEIADHILRTKEYLIQKELSLRSLHHRVDNDSTYEKNVTVTTATSTTAWASTSLTEIDDFWGASAAAHGYCCGINPEAPNWGIARLVTDFAISGDVVTTAAFPQNNSTSTKMHIVRGTALAATDKLTCAALSRVAGIHEAAQTKKFDGGLLRGFIHPAQHADLRSDSTYTNIVQYVEGMKELARYKVFRIYDMELVVIPELYREDVDGTENTAGVVYNSPIFGADTYAVARWTSGEGKFGVKMSYITKPDHSDYWGLNWMINWHSQSAIAVLEACNVVVLMTGATDMAVVF